MKQKQSSASQYSAIYLTNGISTQSNLGIVTNFCWSTWANRTTSYHRHQADQRKLINTQKLKRLLLTEIYPFIQLKVALICSFVLLSSNLLLRRKNVSPKRNGNNRENKNEQHNPLSRTLFSVHSLTSCYPPKIILVYLFCRFLFFPTLLQVN